MIAGKLLSKHHHHHYSNQTCMHSEICGNSMQATVLDDDAMKDDALNDRVAGSVASLDKRKGSIALNTGHFEPPTLGIGCMLLVYEEDDDDDELSVVQRSSCHLWLV